ncbi:DUF4178 domain-containing protein [Massilia sp. Dwa41.01b]|uniref:DUF4178 domain-containing protein n=2 Tax=unclassified Massilia TaxID=2609279 RepID=UPI001E305EA0|nr:DUF4178 domain-containing protein [Massilia sp. Dwa41.01b]
MKDADAVRDLGKMSEVLEDYSPIQVGTAGSHAGRAFTVVGRIQLRYRAGIWNEWYLLFDDGQAGWLGDASGQFMLTIPQPNGWTRWPAFAELRPGQNYLVGDARVTASDVREADCIGGQGELPFRVGAGWQARVADFRRERDFLTLDYSDGEAPLLYKGYAVTLPELKAQLLRDEEQIKTSAGKYRGRVESLLCPSCGSAIGYLPGMATNLVCPSCTARLDATTPQVQVLEQGERAERRNMSLPLGAVAKIGNGSYRVLGAMVRVDEEGSEWSEYLMFSPTGAFFWLVETNEGWSRAQVLDAWPVPAEPASLSVSLEGIAYRKLYDYEARVEHVVGAFDWRVARGDTVRVSEFERGTARLAAEWNTDELTWTRSTPVALDQLRAWFGTSAPKLAQAQPSASPDMFGKVGRCLLWLLGLNVVPLLFNFSGVFFLLLLGALALALPAMLAPGSD